MEHSAKCTCMQHAPTCKLNKAKAAIPDGDVLNKLTDLFKILGDPTRAKILLGLKGRELCVCDLGELVGLTLSAASHQLKALKQASLVSARRDGKNVYYTLDDEHVGAVFNLALEHANNCLNN